MKHRNEIISITQSLMFIFIIGCATTPAPIQESIQLPKTFEEVWYRPTIARPGILVMSDTGNFIVNDDTLEFQGEKYKIKIPFPSIKRISFGKIGTDFMNDWITIEYVEKDTLYAVISAGKSLGWAGGTDKIYSSIQYVIRKNNLNFIKMN